MSESRVKRKIVTAHVSASEAEGRMLRELPQFMGESRAPDGLNLTRMLLGVFRSGMRESLKEFHNRTLFVRAMHFRDANNLDTVKLRRCDVHYATMDGRIMPFRATTPCIAKE